MQGGGTQALFRKGPRRWKEKRCSLPARSLGEPKGSQGTEAGSYLPEHVLRFLKVKVPSCENMGRTGKI